jgi:hypothetical protein
MLLLMLTAGFIIIYYSAGFVCSGQNLQGWIVAYGRDDDVVVAGYPHPSSDNSPLPDIEHQKSKMRKQSC